MISEEIRAKAAKIRYLLFDLDGTLLDRDRRITRRSSDLIMAAKEKGFKIGFSTGRSLCALGGFTGEAGFACNAASVGCAGGEISTVVYDEIVRRHAVYPFPVDRLESLLTFAVDHGFHFSLDGIGDKFCSEGLYYIDRYRRDAERAEAVGRSYPPVTVLSREEIRRALDGTVVKPMIWFGDPAQLPALDEWMRQNPGFAALSSGFRLVEILPREINKATALEQACAVEGVDPSECCVFGDSENDVSILRRAGLSVAMCSGFPEAKQAADLVTAFGNDADGAAETVRELFL